MPAAPIDWVPVLNTTNSIIPGGGLILSSGVDMNGNVQGVQPTGAGQLCLVSDLAPIPPDQIGQATYDNRVKLAYSTSASPPNPGETWGSQAGSWLAIKGSGGFAIVGGAAQGIVNAVRAIGSGSGGCVSGSTGPYVQTNTFSQGGYLWKTLSQLQYYLDPSGTVQLQVCNSISAPYAIDCCGSGSGACCQDLANTHPTIYAQLVVPCTSDACPGGVFNYTLNYVGNLGGNYTWTGYGSNPFCSNSSNTMSVEFATSAVACWWGLGTTFPGANVCTGALLQCGCSANGVFGIGDTGVPSCLPLCAFVNAPYLQAFTGDPTGCSFCGCLHAATFSCLTFSTDPTFSNCAPPCSYTACGAGSGSGSGSGGGSCATIICNGECLPTTLNVDVAIGVCATVGGCSSSSSGTIVYVDGEYTGNGTTVCTHGLTVAIGPFVISCSGNSSSARTILTITCPNGDTYNVSVSGTGTTNPLDLTLTGTLSSEANCCNGATVTVVITE